eukprot:CAMPEP_0184058846 /NCGR_PEP_ID=MMETSP0956-20121227/9567_1 /TAXON_ID=627963 /ORGANISM="Aplanochytrium sp, Strain PBS07" /LENGTH=39 /DNA_ID= /DNA_START= /DNA_END= /DNA_ORIENTATION=
MKERNERIQFTFPIPIDTKSVGEDDETFKTKAGNEGSDH